MGYTVLYIAFGVVALWLLGEVLLQYKAQLRWRVLAFVGFLGVVGGVYLQTVALIALGAIAFAVGQTFVTVSYRRGFSTGWALGGGPGSSRRRRDGGSERSQPTLEVSEIEPVGGGYQEQFQEPPLQPVYQPQPIADETGEYAAYGAPSYATGGTPSYAAEGTPSYAAEGAPSYAAAAESAPSYAAEGTPSFAADAYPPQQDPLAGPGYDGYGGWDSGGYPAYAQPQQGGDAYADAYAAAEQTQYQQPYQQQGPYEDPYAGAGAAPGADPGQYPYQDPYQVPYQDPYAAGGYADPYADPYGSTPAGGVWVPQQQTGEPYVPPAAPDQAAGYDPYRY